MKYHKQLIIRNKKVVNAYRLSKEQIKELNKRHKEYIEGKGKSYTWEEVEEYFKSKIASKNKSQIIILKS